jgi:phage N-6-adenine-methyltransferase
MKAPAALVQSVFDFALREINALEGRIATSEDEADAMLWEQAGQVVAQLEAGLSQRALAAQWINARTGEPYSVAHVNYTAKVYRVKFTEHPRPRFRDCYNAAANTSKRLAQNSGWFEWYTPPELIEAARTVLGGIDLDPASCPEANAVVQADRFFTRDDDGLAQPWRGRIFMNPPYAQPLIAQFADKLASSIEVGDVTAAIALTNNATDTQWFTRLGDIASAVCFSEGRVRFWQPRVSPEDLQGPTQGQAAFYVGASVDRFRDCFRPFGRVWVPSCPR